MTDDGSIVVGNLDSGTIDGDMNGLIEATGAGHIGHLAIGHNLAGHILAADLDNDHVPVPVPAPSIFSAWARM